MTHQIFYLYVDGSDNDAVEAELVTAFLGLASEWSEQGALLVNQKHGRDGGQSESDLPGWDIGLNLPLEGYGIEQANRLIPFAQELAVSTGCEFVFGVVITGVARIWFFLIRTLGRASKSSSTVCSRI